MSKPIQKMSSKRKPREMKRTDTNSKRKQTETLGRPFSNHHAMIVPWIRKHIAPFSAALDEHAEMPSNTNLCCTLVEPRLPLLQHHMKLDNLCRNRSKNAQQKKTKQKTREQIKRKDGTRCKSEDQANRDPRSAVVDSQTHCSVQCCTG